MAIYRNLQLSKEGRALLRRKPKILLTKGKKILFIIISVKEVAAIII